jgi:hypothetical protein
MGVYLVKRVWRDERGGVYFCVSNDSMFDTTSFGFAHDPNPVGTPFGAAHLTLRPLGGSWFYFSANNDWY